MFLTYQLFLFCSLTSISPIPIQTLLLYDFWRKLVSPLQRSSAQKVKRTAIVPDLHVHKDSTNTVFHFNTWLGIRYQENLVMSVLSYNGNNSNYIAVTPFSWSRVWSWWVYQIETVNHSANQNELWRPTTPNSSAHQNVKCTLLDKSFIYAIYILRVLPFASYSISAT